MLRRVVQHVLHVYGNGRAAENARGITERERFANERIDALHRRVPAAARTRGRRGAA
jgi:hypothetical protein